MTKQLSDEEERRLVARLVEIARELEAGGDGFLAGHYMHLRERAQAVGAILETGAESVI